MKELTMKTVKILVFLFVCLHSCLVAYGQVDSVEDVPVLRLYTKTIGVYKALLVNPVSIAPFMNNNKSLIIYTFGVNGRPDSSEVKTIIPTLISNRNSKYMNSQVMLYDWSKKNSLDPLGLLKMNQVAVFLRELQPMGCQLGKTLVRLVELGLDHNKIVLIGHGMGAALMDYAGKCFKQDYGKKVKLIWGLDPVGSLYGQYFEMVPRMHSGNADHVYVLHTDPDGYGSTQSMGTVDFFAGYDDEYLLQPGCAHKANPMSWDTKYRCNHDRAWKVFTAGVRVPRLLPAANAGNGNNWLLGEGDPSDIAYITLGTTPKYASENLPPGYEQPWLTWKSLNRLRTQVGRSKENLFRASGNYFLRLGPHFPYSLHRKGIYPMVEHKSTERKGRRQHKSKQKH